MGFEKKKERKTLLTKCTFCFVFCVYLVRFRWSPTIDDIWLFIILYADANTQNQEQFMNYKCIQWFLI